MNAIQQARQAGVVLDEQNAIAEDLPCIGCGYLLRSMTPDRDCPECGRVISDTTRIQRLRQYPITWLKQMRFGMQQNMRMVATTTLTIVDVLIVGVLFPGAVGFWLLTQPFQPNEKTINWRRLARLITLSSVLGFVLCLEIPSVTEIIGLYQTMGVLTAWFAIGAWAILQHASTIANMIPHRRMSTWSKRLGVLTLVYLLLCACFGGYQSYGFNAIKAPISTRIALNNFGPAVGAGFVVVLCVIYLLFLSWYQRRFTEACSQVNLRSNKP
jgi:hypothetical protein